MYIFQGVGDAQIKVVQRVGLHLSGDGKGLAEKQPFGLGKSSHSRYKFSASLITADCNQE